MKELNRSFEKALQTLAPRGRSFLLAVSGGIDSICMLDLFCSFRKKYGYHLAVAYVNHNLRRDESVAEEALVKKTALRYGIECFSLSVDRREWEQREGQSIEMKARRIRYDFFGGLLAKHGFDYLATAHNFDDKIETLFLQLFRAGGTETLVSIPEKTTFSGNVVIRPLLDVSREEIVSYVNQKNLPYSEDSTNKEDIYKRNIIRNRLAPHFPVIHSDYRKSFKHLFSYLEEQDSYLKEQTESEFSRCLAIGHSRAVALHLDRFVNLHSFMKKNVVKACLKMTGYPVKPNKAMLDAVCSSGRISYRKKGFSMVAKRKYLWLIKEEENTRDFQEVSLSPGLSGKSEFTFPVPGYRVTLEKTADFDLKSDFVVSTAVLEGPNEPLYLRRVCSEDCIMIGDGEKNVFAMLSDAGYPRQLFPYLLALVKNGRIAAVFCLDYFRVASEWYVESRAEEAVKVVAGFLKA